MTTPRSSNDRSPTFGEQLRWRRAQLGRFHLTLGLIALAGFLFRAGYVLVAKRNLDTCDRELCGDAFWYSASANVFAFGQGFENRFGPPDQYSQAADHPPLTTLLIAPTNVVFLRHSVLAQRMGMCLLGTLVIVLVGLLARRLAGDGAGIAAAAVAAINANLWMNDVVVMAETVGAVTLLCVLFAAYRLADQPVLRRAVVAGLALGFAGLARAELLLYGPLLLLPLCLSLRAVPLPRRVLLVAASGATALVSLAPWTIYNLSRFDEPVLLSTNDGLTIIGANCDRVYGVDDPGGVGFWNLQCRFDADAEFGIPLQGDQSTQARKYREIGLRYVGDHQSLLPKVITIRVARVWGAYGPDQMVWLNQGEGRDTWASVTGYVMWWGMLIPSVIGAIVLWRRRVRIWPLLAAIPVVTITAVLFYGIVRFRLPADLSATLLTGVAIEAGRQKWRERGA